MKLVLSIVAAVGFASIAVALWIAHRVAEPTVVRDPYEEGLHYDDHRHASDPTGGKRVARKAAPSTPPPPAEAPQSPHRSSPPAAPAELSAARAPAPGRDEARPGVRHDERGQGSTTLPASGEREMKGLRAGPGSTSLPPAGGGPGRGAATGCDLQAGPCTRQLPDGAEVTLSIGPRPVRAMGDLEFTVSVTPASAAAGGGATVALSMPHMYMGETRVALAAAGEGVFRGKGVLVRCASGRRDWAADVRIDRAGAPVLTARFPLVAAE